MQGQVMRPSAADSEESKAGVAAGAGGANRTMRPLLQHTQINKVMHHEAASSSRFTEEGIEHTGSSRTEDDCSNNLVEEEVALATGARRQGELDPCELSASPFAVPMGDQNFAIGRPSKAHAPAAQMKQLQNQALHDGKGVSGRQSLALSGASSLIEIKAINHSSGNRQLLKQHRITKSISGSKVKHASGSPTQQLLIHLNSSPPKKMRQKSQASFSKLVPGPPQLNQNAASMASDATQQPSASHVRKLRKNSPPVQQPMAKKKGSGPSHREKSSLSGAREPLVSVSLPPKNHILTLAQKQSKERNKPNATRINSRSKSTKKARSLLREQEKSPEKIVLTSQNASQDGEQPARSESVPAEKESSRYASQVEEAARSTEVRLVSAGAEVQVRRASERHRQQCVDIEEEKEVPSEHPPNNKKITPTRNGCNVTTRKGFSFENNMMVLNQHLQSIQKPLLTSNQEVIEAGFVVIDPESSRALLTDIEEMESGQDIIQNSVAPDVSKLPNRTKNIAKKSSQMMTSSQPRQHLQIQHQQDHNEISAQNLAGRNNTNKRGLFRDAKMASNDSVASIEENKVVMKMTRFQQNTQMMPQTTPLPVKQQFHQAMNHEDQALLRIQRSRPSQAISSNLHQSMASCDLQVSFQRIDDDQDARNVHETTGRTKSMMYANRAKASIASDPFIEAPSPSYQEDRTSQLIESAEYQAISKTRLWTEIFYLRELLDGKNEAIGRLKDSVQDLHAKLETEKLKNGALERQLAELKSAKSERHSRREQQFDRELTEEEEKHASSHLLIHEQQRKAPHSQPILQNELVRRQSRQQAAIPQHASNIYAVTEEQDIGVIKRTPHHGINRASQVNFQQQDTLVDQGIVAARQGAHNRKSSSPQPFVNCFNPPTKASQLRIQQPALRMVQAASDLASQDSSLARPKPVARTTTSKYQHLHRQQQLQQENDEDDAVDSSHAMPPLGLNMVHATTRAQSALIARNSGTTVGQAFHHQIEICSSTASLQNRVDEEIYVNQMSHNEEEEKEENGASSLLINKVNEMQTKAASFGYQQPQQTANVAGSGNESLPNQRFYLYRQQSPTQQQQHQLGGMVSASQTQQVVQDEAIDSSERIHMPLSFAEQEQFLEYDIDEQVSSGVRVMNGPRSGPPRQSFIRQGQQQQQAQVLNRLAGSQHQLLTSQTSLSQHNQIEVPLTLQTQQAAFNNHTQTVSQYQQSVQLQHQRPCDQPPPRNIQGDVQSHVDAEEISNIEGVGSGLVPQQRIPLPNQQQQAMPRQPSHDDSLLEPPDSHPQFRHHRLQPQLQQQLQYVPLGFSFADDAGMDEFDVADERLHLFGEQVNPDIMTYEQLLALQERIGFVPKGMTVQEMDKYPTMKRSQVRRYLNQGTQNRHKRLQKAPQSQIRSQHEQRLSEQEPPAQSQRQALQDLDQPGHDLPTFQPQAAEADEEEKKSAIESNADKSSIHFTMQDSYDHGSFTDKVQDRSMHSNSACGAEMALQQLQLENYQSLQNSRTSTTLINDGRMSNQIRNQVRLRGINFKVPMIELQSDHGGEENHELSSVKTRQPSASQLIVNVNQFNSLQGEEGKEDLEEAAPEEHHPKEEHLQQIGVSVPMPGHHIASHGGVAMVRLNVGRNSSSQLANPSAQQIPHVSNQVIVVSEEEEDEHEDNENENNHSQEGASQEDVFDEGEDVINRRLPIVVNINGSIPNQRPSHTQQMQSQQLAVDFERQHPLYAGAIAIQNNLARQSKALTKEQVAEDADLGGVNSTGSNIYEEHNEDEYGVQAPKYAQTKTNQKQHRHQMGRRSHAANVHHVEYQLGNNSQILASSSVRHFDQPTLVKHHGQPTIAGRHANMSGLKMTPNSGNLALTSQRQSVQSSTLSQAESSNVSTQLGSEICIVCQEVFCADDPVKVLIPCKHYFHVNCVNQWLLVEKKCPMCMIPLD